MARIADGMKVPLLDLARQWKPLEREALEEVRRTFEDMDFILGRRVEALEKEIAAHCRTDHAVGCASGTDALLLALRCLGIGPGDEVVTTPFTFFATGGAIHNCGARPVFVDIEPDTFNIDPAAAAAAVGPRTRAILPVHLFGRCATMGPILEAASRGGVAVIEDMAQSLGAEHRGLRAGAMGDAGAISFYPSKNLGGCGDGGMVVTPWKDLASRLRMARNHGQAARYEHDFVGTNSRLDGLQAAVLLVKMRRLDGWRDARAAHARRYGELLDGLDGVRVPSDDPKGRHVWNQYTIRCERRDGLKAHLDRSGIGTAVYYPIPLHLQRCFAHLGHRPGAFPEAERASREVLSLPVFPELREEEQEYVAGRIRAFYRG